MFNLENQIAEWRRQLQAGGITQTQILDELESHLREDIQQQMQSGANAQQAFAAAVEKLGEARPLKMEFDKSKPTRPFMKKINERAYCFLFCGFYLLICGWAVLSTGLSLPEKMLGLLPVMLSALFIYASPFAHRFLPAIREPRIAARLRVGAILFCIVGPVLAMNFILPRLNLMPDQVRIAVLWILTPFALAGSLWQGFDDAHKKRALAGDC